MNEATKERVEKALQTLAIKGVYFNAEYELDDFWSVREDVGAEAKNWDCYLRRIELGHENYRLIPMNESVSLIYLGQTTSKLNKTVDYYFIEWQEGDSFAISHHIDQSVDDGFVIGPLDMFPDFLVARLVEQ